MKSNVNKKNKALFLDRDGIVNKDVRYAHKPEQIQFCDGIFDLCKAAVQKGYLIIIVTNQAGVAKGHFLENDVHVLHQWIKEQFEQQKIEIRAFYYCPYHVDGIIKKYKKDSDCRKPKPGMFLQAAAEHSIDIAQSFMVGDKSSDRIQLEELRCVIVKSNYIPEGYDVLTIRDVIPLL